MDFASIYIHKRRIFWAGAAIIIIGLVLFSPAGLYFLNDDLIHIPLSSKGELMQRHSWRPVGDLSIALDWLVWRKTAWGYHLSSLLLHCVSTLLVGVFTKTLFHYYMPGAPQQWLVRWLSAVLFFVYAFHSEAVFWIIGRSASLAMIFALPAFTFYLKRHAGKQFIWLSLVCFQMAMFAYESVWIFPVLTIVFSAVTVYKNGGKWKDEVFYLTIIWISFVAHLIVRFNYLGEVAGKYEASHFKTLNIPALASNYAKLLLRTFLPPVQQSWQLLAGAAVLFVVVAAIIYRVRKLRVPVLIPVIAGICLLVSYLPYLSLGIDTHGVESERYLYMPSLFAVLLLAWAIVFVFTRFAIPVFVLTAIYHLFFLYASRIYFSEASQISRATFSQVNLLNNKKRLFIDSLPDEVSGALIFRLGFTEGVAWLKNDKTVDSVIVLTRKLNDIGDENFSSKEVRIIINPAGDVPGRLQRYRYDVATATFQSDSAFIYNPVTDAYFRYDKGNWLIWK